MNKRKRRQLAKAGKPVIKLHFLGAAGHVTGSMNLVEYWQGEKVTRFLLDAGLDMEHKSVDRSNRFPKGLTAKDIDFVIVSHAHIDHSGYVPKMVKDGFRGKVYCTPSSIDLCKILLPDSGYLQEKEAERLNRRGSATSNGSRSRKSTGKSTTARKSGGKTNTRNRAVKKHEPLYTQRAAERSLKYFSPLGYHETHQLAPGVKIRFTEAGHILGAAVTTVEIGEGGHKKTLCFTGNVGPRNAPLLRKLEAVSGADYLITESTYGNKSHGKDNRLDQLAGIINRAYERAKVPERRKGKGVILIPAFAVGRTPAVLNDLRLLMEQGKIPMIATFLDGRMSISATQVHRDYRQDLCEETQAVFEDGRDPFKPPRFAQCVKWQQSQALMEPPKEPVIIVGSSGMATGGRIVGHLQRRLGTKNNTVIFVGYQGRGTLGHSLVRFADNRPASIEKCEQPKCPKTVRVDGKQIRVRAEIEYLGNYSAHADYKDILWWLGQFKRRPQQTFVVHGDEDALSGLQERIQAKLGWEVVIPKSRETFYLT